MQSTHLRSESGMHSDRGGDLRAAPQEEAALAATAADTTEAAIAMPDSCLWGRWCAKSSSYFGLMVGQILSVHASLNVNIFDMFEGRRLDAGALELSPAEEAGR